MAQWELITPDSLAELDSSQNTKLSGVETGATVGAAWGSNLTGRPTELTDGRVGSGLASNGDVARTVAVSKGGTGETLTNRFLNNQINISTSNNSIIIQRGGYSDTTVTGLGQSLVGLSGVVNNADVTGSNTAFDTARVNGTTASTVRAGAAAGATANQDSTSTIRNGVTTATITSGSNSHVWTIESDTEYAPNVGTLTTTIEWRNGSGTLLTTATIVSDINEDDRNIDVSRSGSGVSYAGSGTASNIGAGGSTTIASYNSIKVSVFHAVIDTSSWTFK
mgnify:CR=1 FL=1